MLKNNKMMMFHKMPKNIRVEMEKMQQLIYPIMKKRSRYILFSIPLIGVSLFHLFFLLFYTPFSQQTLIMMLLYALLGAVGFALSKEGKYKNKQMKQVSFDYMVKRVKESPYINENRKKEYVKLIKEQPVLALNSFVSFLNEEENHARRWQNN